MAITALPEIFERDLNRLKNEINLYKDDNSLWVVKDGISNSGGNLCLHLIGNLNHYIGVGIGQSGYIRNRENEFSTKNISRQELVKRIEDTIIIVSNSLAKLSTEDLEKIFPIDIFGNPATTDFILIHLATHLTYHLGQINYHRRLMT